MSQSDPPFKKQRARAPWEKSLSEEALYDMERKYSPFFKFISLLVALVFIWVLWLVLDGLLSYRAEIINKENNAHSSQLIRWKACRSHSDCVVTQGFCGWPNALNKSHLEEAKKFFLSETISGNGICHFYKGEIDQANAICQDNLCREVMPEYTHGLMSISWFNGLTAQNVIWIIFDLTMLYFLYYFIIKPHQIDGRHLLVTLTKILFMLSVPFIIIIISVLYFKSLTEREDRLRPKDPTYCARLVKDRLECFKDSDCTLITTYSSGPFVSNKTSAQKYNQCLRYYEDFSGKWVSSSVSTQNFQPICQENSCSVKAIDKK